MTNKYWMTFQQSWQNGLAYPLSFALWRIRQVLSTLMSLAVWMVIFSQNKMVFGYDQSSMISYIFLVSILQGAIIATSLNSLSSDIYSGTVSQLFIKPVNIFKYLLAQEFADKGRNLLLICFETAVLWLIFKPSLHWPGLAILGLTILWTIMGVIINFLVQILFGTLGFWSPESWGPKFLFYVIVDATAGKLFPLNIFPKIVQEILFLTPFPYLSYVQTQLFLDKLSPIEVLKISGGMIFWAVLLGIAVTKVWRYGIKNYSASGQ